MGETLAEMTTPTVPSECNRTEEHLCPSNNWIRLANNTMNSNSPRTNGLFLNMELEVYPESNLDEERDENNIGRYAVYSGKEGTSAMSVT